MKRSSVLIAVFAVAAHWFACTGDDSGGYPSTSSTGSSSGCHTHPGDPCTSNQDCCIGIRKCGESVCAQGVCGIDLVKEFPSQTRGDCEVMQCDESGAPVPVPFPEDVPNDGNPCTKDYCNGATVVIGRGARGPVPDGSGFCNGDDLDKVQCLATADCEDAALICSRKGKCIPPSCNNRVFEPALGETAIDCGGPCDPCQVGYACGSGSDCQYGVCSPEGMCAAPTCDDGVKNSFERDVDCGSFCHKPCDVGMGCFGPNDCTSWSCFAGTCQPPTCNDGVKNGSETGFDCGGDCPPCE
jgi:hypothetical protein